MITKKYFSLLKIATMFIFMCLNQAYATHLRGGEIEYKQLGGYTYRFTIRLYLNSGPGIALQDKIDFYPGDGNLILDIPFTRREPINNGNLLKNEWIVDYTYAAPGNYFAHAGTIGTSNGRFEFIPNWNAGIINLRDASGSSEMPMYIETFIPVGTLQDVSISLADPPVFTAQSGKKYISNLKPRSFSGADSLAFRLVTPLQIGRNVTYSFPDDVKINQVSGEMTWTPTRVGEYVFFVRVELWLKGERISFANRAFLVVVTDFKNELNLVVNFLSGENFPSNGLLNVKSGQEIALQVLFSGDVTEKMLLLNNTETDFDKPVSFSITDSAGLKKGIFRWKPQPSQKRNYPYVFVFRGVGKGGGRTLAKDFTVLVFVDVTGTETPPRPGEFPKPTATESEITARQVKVYPNPATEQVTIYFFKPLRQARLSVFSLNGQYLKAFTDLNGSFIHLNVSDLPAGMYLFQVLENTKSVGQGKLIKQ